MSDNEGGGLEGNARLENGSVMSKSQAWGESIPRACACVVKLKDINGKNK